MTQKEYQHQYYLANRDRLRVEHRKSAKKFAEDFKQRDPEGFKQYRRKYKRRWDRKAMLDPLHRLGNNIRAGMHHALKGKKGFRKWEDLVGYTLQDLVNHIEPLLSENMTWDNYGLVWHVDHITPKSWFKYTSINDAKFKECWALSNLQPKLRADNIRKGNRFVG
jgi:hypothetical protein